ncbi:unnamed protein product [Rhizopus microsporus]
MPSKSLSSAAKTPISFDTQQKQFQSSLKNWSSLAPTEAIQRPSQTSWKRLENWRIIRFKQQRASTPKLPQSLKYLEEQSEENKRLAFSQGTVEKISQVRFEAAVIQRATNI